MESIKKILLSLIVFYVAIQIIGKYLLFINYLFINHLS